MSATNEKKRRRGRQREERILRFISIAFWITLVITLGISQHQVLFYETFYLCVIFIRKYRVLDFTLFVCVCVCVLSDVQLSGGKWNSSTWISHAKYTLLLIVSLVFLSRFRRICCYRIHFMVSFSHTLPLSYSLFSRLLATCCWSWALALYCIPCVLAGRFVYAITVWVFMFLFNLWSKNDIS